MVHREGVGSRRREKEVRRSGRGFGGVCCLELLALPSSPIKSLCGRGTLCVMHTLEGVRGGLEGDRGGSTQRVSSQITRRRLSDAHCLFCFWQQLRRCTPATTTALSLSHSSALSLPLTLTLSLLPLSTPLYLLQLQHHLVFFNFTSLAAATKKKQEEERMDL